MRLSVLPTSGLHVALVREVEGLLLLLLSCVAADGGGTAALTQQVWRRSARACDRAPLRPRHRAQAPGKQHSRTLLFVDEVVERMINVQSDRVSVYQRH